MKNNEFLKMKFNEFGTEVSEHKCMHCGTTFTVCPAEPEWSGGCMSIECSSYIKECDMDLLFITNPEKIGSTPTGRYN